MAISIPPAVPLRWPNLSLILSCLSLLLGDADHFDVYEEDSKDNFPFFTKDVTPPWFVFVYLREHVVAHKQAVGH
jgi:hypothetical protein